MVDDVKKWTSVKQAEPKGYGKQDFGSGSIRIRIQSGQWIRIRIRNPDPDPGGKKLPTKVISLVCPLLRAEGFFCKLVWSKKNLIFFQL